MLKRDEPRVPSGEAGVGNEKNQCNPLLWLLENRNFTAGEAGLLHSKNANAGDTDAGTLDGSGESCAGVHLAAQAGACFGDNKTVIGDSIATY